MMPASTLASNPGARLRALVIVSVLGGIAIGLRVLDGVPPWWLGQPRTPVRYASLFELERQQRTRLLVPFVFPDALRWPPARIWLAPGGGRPVLLEFDRADGTGVGLLLAQTLDGDHRLPSRLLPEPATRESVPGESGPGDGAWPDAPTLERGTAADGRTFLELTQVVEGRRVVLRWFDQDAIPLMRMARSLRRG